MITVQSLAEVRRAVVRGLLGVAVLGAVEAQAAWDVTIAASGASSGGAWSGNTWTANASGARVLASEVQAHLAEGPTTISTGGDGDEPGDLYVHGDITWDANALTLHAAHEVIVDGKLTASAHDIIVDGELIGSTLGTLVVEYGQGAVAEGNTALYRFNTPASFTSDKGDPTIPYLTIKGGSDGVVRTHGVPKCKGSRGSSASACSFLKGSPPDLSIEFHTREYEGRVDTPLWIYLNPLNLYDPAYAFVLGCDASKGTPYYAISPTQSNYFDADGTILDLEGLESVTTITKTCTVWSDGPTARLGNTYDFPNGFYIKFAPAPGKSGNAYTVIQTLVTPAEEGNTGYTMVDLIIHVVPDPPTATGATDLTLDGSTTTGTTTLALTGTGALTTWATSSNTTLVPNANITGAGDCTAEGDCTLTVTRAAGQYGAATVTVTVEDFWGQQASDSFTVSATPEAPTVSGAGTLAITAPASGSHTLTLTGAGALTAWATSSDTTLLPDANIDGADGCTAAGPCTLSVTPAAGQHGTATVTVTVEDAWGLQDSTSFTVIVAAPTAPAIAGVTDLAIAGAGSANAGLTLTGTGALTLTATSGNTTLLPDAGIVHTCTAAGACILTLTPAAGRTGSAEVTLTVTDAWGQQASAGFTLTVTPPTAPAITGAANLAIVGTGSANASLDLTGTGALTVTAASGNTTLLPNANITGAAACTAAGPCTLTLTPAAGRTGSANVTVTVTDAWGQQGSASFTLNVAAPAAPAITGAANLAIAGTGSANASLNLTGTGALTLTAASSDTTLLPNAGITGAAACTAAGPCTLTLSPVAGRTGSANVTVTVTDAWGQQGSASFTLNVAAPAAPAITGAANLVIAPSGSASASLTLTGTGPLTVQATSSDAALLPNANIAGAGGCTAAGACTLTVAPAAGQLGTATITVTVEDVWGQRASTSFTVEVRTAARVLYDANGSAGAVPVDAAIYQTGDAVVVLDGAPERTGHTFTGWNTARDGSGTAYAPGATFTIDGDVTLYAQWRSETTRVSLGGGGAFGLEWLVALWLFAGGWLRRRGASA